MTQQTASSIHADDADGANEGDRGEHGANALAHDSLTNDSLTNDARTNAAGPATAHSRTGSNDIVASFNGRAVAAIYRFEMARMRRTLLQSVVSPVLSTALYFVVFGTALGSQIRPAGDIAYGAFIVPGLMMMAILNQSVSNASFAIYFPKFAGTIYEILSAPISAFEILLGYVGAAATKSVVLGLIILATAGALVPLRIDHPIWMLTFLVLTAITFCLLGFIIGIWADNFEKLQFVPMLIVTPLTFLGGTFYSIDMLPPFWQTVSLLNPVVYLVSAFRWSFFGTGDVAIGVSVSVIVLFLAACVLTVWWIFRTGYRLKQ